MKIKRSHIAAVVMLLLVLLVFMGKFLPVVR